jgi:hypothetical protein
MGNIFSFCFKVNNNSEINDSHLLEKLNKDQYNNSNLDYASFIDNNNSMIYDNLSLINQKIEILEKNTQNNFITIQKDIKHIYTKQAEIKNFINMSSTTLTNSDNPSIDNPSIDNPSIHNKNIDCGDYEESVYLDTNTNISSEEETY